MIIKPLHSLPLLLPLTTSSLLPRQRGPEIPYMGEQSCRRQWFATSPGGMNVSRKLCFTTNVGAIWDNGRGCPGILEALNEACPPGVLDWVCMRGKSLPTGTLHVDYTRLHFCCPVQRWDGVWPSVQEVAGPVDDALESIYAGAVHTSFNCGAL